MLIKQSKILNNVNSSMQCSASKEIEIRAALSSDYGPSPNTGQSFFDKFVYVRVRYFHEKYAFVFCSHHVRVW